ncbi:hypothetical protein GGS23DRAFT_598022 [Durotheca rogersii]|uniref:uncharacterized protein n=1 Tax=Durotheca rogersii TaxID=419775 RepID=UPI00221E6E30|nr:uncharacterized protein GGS23DRAFT_598022 [Durotheca rogersii]KAI5862005.1 hypothetical protein GGS23DRAFT_598022 [Durotheca rogersii]
MALKKAQKENAQLVKANRLLREELDRKSVHQDNQRKAIKELSNHVEAMQKLIKELLMAERAYQENQSPEVSQSPKAPAPSDSNPQGHIPRRLKHHDSDSSSSDDDDKNNKKRKSKKHAEELERKVFDVSLHESCHLRGVSGWVIFRNAFLLYFAESGYEKGMKMSRLEDLHLARVITNNCKGRARRLVLGMESGIEMLKLFAETYTSTKELETRQHQKLAELLYADDSQWPRSWREGRNKPHTTDSLLLLDA